MDKLNLLLAIHCHQPVGNFGVVFSKAYDLAYLPFVGLLEKYPNIKISLHYSGSLLDWLEITNPEFLKRINNLVKKGQVEILAGGYYEPILSLVPQADAQAQIEMLKSKIKELFSFKAEGCWLTERVWEPRLASVLNAGGIRWTIVDDSNFKSAGLDPENLSGYYLTEDEGMPLAIFPASEKLRYLMPFKLPKETIDYLKNLYQEQRVKCVCFADDGEKFGLWPGTNKWVYEQKWLENFFALLRENKSWLNVASFSEYYKLNPATGRIYLNCASYREMMEWSGGYFRNFFLKYQEANWMHKRMLYVSQKLGEIKDIYKTEKATLKKEERKKIKEDSQLAEASRHLYMAQANDTYWHGVFGGLYLNHLRSAVYCHIIEAEKLISKLRRCEVDMRDIDYDGQDEIVMSNDYLSCFFSPHRAGALLELDYKPKSINLINTLMRRSEPYHKKIKQNLMNIKSSPDQPQSIHDLARVKQNDLKNFLFYDSFPRHCCLDHFLHKQTDSKQFFRCEYEELGDFIQGKYEINQRKKSKDEVLLELSRSGKVHNYPVNIIKMIHLNNNELTLVYTIKNESTNHLDNLFGIEFNLSVYDNRFSKASGEIKADLLEINDIWNNISLEFSLGVPACVFYFPVETISDSETGIEKIYQELCLFFNWQLDIAPRREWSTKLSLRIKG